MVFFFVIFSSVFFPLLIFFFYVLFAFFESLSFERVSLFDSDFFINFYDFACVIWWETLYGHHYNSCLKCFLLFSPFDFSHLSISKISLFFHMFVVHHYMLLYGPSYAAWSWLSCYRLSSVCPALQCPSTCLWPVFQLRSHWIF